MSSRTRQRRRLASETYLNDNIAAALVIMADPDRYGGEGSLAVKYSRRVLEAAAIIDPPRPIGKPPSQLGLWSREMGGAQ
jgi:hypothetical protein